ncbi:uncharacterized protein STEHIDRAFT_57139 [Stereum hirsutum FP-91666 SS1]|uniref:uncharacterized protein n=1 Tax=Stereum hirsutum (strain FP-91666) TaxID=721885 RepID=UPI000440C6EE|nr:uncharacterized protein STEHIDRAFT_57139 [Stereum hirsutum FP-91666 SS1]EIM86585.1 hypothetical protein STEHIDRAFT_57139 [Stereum hirsutum FP-91666 SS1]
MENSVKPDVERWRSTLDTLLIFIALFSAVVTSFLVQASTGLSQDPSDRTNELLSNLTEIIIQLSANTSALHISPPTQFDPDPRIVRLNVYWSLSLIISVSHTT